MTTYTENLNLFKYEPEIDGKKTFNIKNALNNNWDIIDAKINNVNNKITNCIIEAPNGVFEKNSNGKYYAPRGLRFLSANGKNTDGSINNVDFTLTRDVVFTNLWLTNVDYCVFYLYSNDKTNWSYAGRTLKGVFFEQEETPNINYGATWFNTKDYIWRINTLVDGSYYWKACNVIPLAVGRIDADGNIAEIYNTSEIIEILNSSSRLTNLQQTNLEKPTALSYNTVFTAPCDGTIYVSTDIKTLANYQTPTSTIQVKGQKGVFSGISTAVTNKVEYTQSGTYTIEVSEDGYCDITLVGGGGNQDNGINSMSYMSYASGGSGAAFSGQVYLTAGTHTITVGGVAGASSIDDLIIAGGGGNGTKGANFALNPAGGAGGTLTINGEVQEVTIQSNGNSGGSSNIAITQAGGASLYNGYGAGASSPSGKATTGYCYITYPTTINSAIIDCYTHELSTHWDGSGNTVHNESTQSNEIQAFRGEQYKFFTNEQTGNTTMNEFVGVFYPCKKVVN